MNRDFWSRRREAVAKEAQAESAALVAEREAEREAALAEKTDEELLTEAGFAAPEELDTPEMIQAFLRSTLPQRLKTRALRRLWRLNPILANLDGLNDYDDDYTIGATGMGPIQTTYQVGKGLLRHVEEMARQAEEKANPTPPVELVEEPEETPVALPEPVMVLAEVETETDSAPEAEPAEAAPAPRRRMTFTFDEQRTL